MIQIDKSLDILTAYEDEFFILTTTDGEIVYPSMFHAKLFLDNLTRLKNGEFFNKTTNEYFIRDVRTHFYNGQLHYLYRYKNITEKKSFEKRYFYDQTTDILIKRRGYELFDEYLEKIIDSKELEEFTVVIADANEFKAINDTYGHLAGDKAIRTIAQTFNSNFRTNNVSRENDIIYRFGGDEFGIVIKDIPRVTSQKRLNDVSKIILSKRIVSNPKEDDTPYDFGIQCSFGAIHVNNQTISDVLQGHISLRNFRNDIINQADKCLYESKKDKKKNSGKVYLKKYKL